MLETRTRFKEDCDAVTPAMEDRGEAVGNQDSLQRGLRLGERGGSYPFFRCWKPGLASKRIATLRQFDNSEKVFDVGNQDSLQRGLRPQPPLSLGTPNQGSGVGNQDSLQRGLRLCADPTLPILDLLPLETRTRFKEDCDGGLWPHMRPLSPSRLETRTRFKEDCDCLAASLTSSAGFGRVGNQDSLQRGLRLGL